MGAQPHGELSGSASGKGAPHALCERRAAVQSEGHFDPDEGTPSSLTVYPLKVEFMERPRVVGERDVHTGPTQYLGAAAGERCGIRGTDHDALNSSLYERVCARSSPAHMGARLERDVGCRALGVGSGCCKCGGLGMGTARALVPALAHDNAVAHEDATDDRIGSGGTPAALCELAGAPQVRVVDARVRVAEVASHLLDILLPSGL
jgi:hypothetical protein